MRVSVVRHLSLWWSFFSNTLTRDMEFKANFIGSLIVDAVYYGAHYFFFSIIFSYVDVLGQFTASDVKIFLVIPAPMKPSPVFRFFQEIYLH